MNISSLLKSPYSLGGAGIVGTGGLSVGSWQIYEESNPTFDRNLNRQGYRYSPVVAPREAKPENAKFNLKSGDCVNRLFPGVEIKYESPSTDTGQYDINLPTISNPNKFITCAIMEMKPFSVVGASKKNQIYFKAEVVIKGENQGWILGTLLSTLSAKQNENSYEHPINFIYRLLSVKKTNDTWEVDTGIEGNHYISEGCKDAEQLVIAPPTNQENGFTANRPRKCTDATPFREKTWVGIGEIDEDSKITKKHLLEGITIYNIDNNVSNKEVWGSDGEFVGQDGDLKGYVSVQNVYVKGHGWKRKAHENISPKLKEGYKPFRDKKIRWSDLNGRCDSGSRIRNKTIISEEEDLRALCYYKATK